MTSATFCQEAVVKRHQALVEVAARGKCQQPARRRAIARAPVEPESKGQGQQEAKQRTPRQRDTGQALAKPEANGQ